MKKNIPFFSMLMLRCADSFFVTKPITPRLKIKHKFPKEEKIGPEELKKLSTAYQINECIFSNDNYLHVGPITESGQSNVALMFYVDSSFDDGCGTNVQILVVDPIKTLSHNLTNGECGGQALENPERFDFNQQTVSPLYTGINEDMGYIPDDQVVCGYAVVLGMPNTSQNASLQFLGCVSNALNMIVQNYQDQSSKNCLDDVEYLGEGLAAFLAFIVFCVTIMSIYRCCRTSNTLSATQGSEESKNCCTRFFNRLKNRTFFTSTSTSESTGLLSDTELIVRNRS